MYLKLTASKDTYITNKIIDSTTSASHANVGQASTLDLFKLYNENAYSGVTNPIELSKILIKFDLAKVSSSIKDKISMDHSSFKCTLSLKDVQGSHVAPSSFNVSAFPLSNSFDEGLGRDLYSFNDLDRANWMTRSISNSTNYLWNEQGADSSGSLNSTNIDLIGSGVLGSTLIEFAKSQYFDTGIEDLEIDVTAAVSASACGLMSDNGFCIQFSGSEATDTASRFVKRFASKQSRNPFLKPELIVEYDDAINDNHNNFYFDTEGTLFLTNFSAGGYTNILSASTSLTGDSAMKVKLSTGSWSKSVIASIHSSSGIPITGFYSASFTVTSSDSATVSYNKSLYNHIIASGSIVFGEQWLSIDETVQFYSGTLEISNQQISTTNKRRDLRFSILNLNSKYKKGTDPRIRFFIRDKNLADEPSRIPISLSSITLDEVYYRIKDINTGTILVPFRKENQNNSTRLSSDSDGMYFNLSTNAFPIGRNYTIELLVIDRGVEAIYETQCAFEVVV